MKQENSRMEKIFQNLGDFKLPQPGEVVECTIILKEPGFFMVSIKNAFVGIIAGKELNDGFGTVKKLKVGDVVSAFVLDDENEDGIMILSLRKANQMKNWDYFEQCMHDGTAIEIVAKTANKGGLICDANGIHAFLPVSQLAPKNYPRVDGANSKAIIEKLEEFIGKKFTVGVITFLRNEKIIVSEKEALSKIREKEVKELKIGDVVEGEINGVVKFGIFIIFGNLEGLIHSSEISWKILKNHYEFFKIGDKVKAQIIGIDNGKISLSIKRLQKDPWEQLLKKYPPGKITEGEVNKITNFGIFVTLDGNLNGLVHSSEFKNPEMRSNEIAKVGDKIKVRILEANEEDHNLKLSMKLSDSNEKKEEKKSEKENEEK